MAEEKSLIFDKLLKVQAACADIKLDQQTSYGGNYRYASWQSVVREVKKNLIQYGLLITFKFYNTKYTRLPGLANKRPALIKVSFDVIISDGHHVDRETYAFQECIIKLDEATEDFIKKFGTIQSYVRKYFYIQLFNLLTDEEDYEAKPTQPVRVQSQPQPTHSQNGLNYRNQVKELTNKAQSIGGSICKRFGEVAKQIGGEHGYFFSKGSEQMLSNLISHIEKVDLFQEKVYPSSNQEPDPDSEPKNEGDDEPITGE